MPIKPVSKISTKEIRESLQAYMDTWFEKEWQRMSDLGWIGDKCGNLMAEAALSVLLAQLDVQAYLSREGLLEPEA